MESARAKLSEAGALGHPSPEQVFRRITCAEHDTHRFLPSAERTLRLVETGHETISSVGRFAKVHFRTHQQTSSPL